MTGRSENRRLLFVVLALVIPLMGLAVTGCESRSVGRERWLTGTTCAIEAEGIPLESEEHPPIGVVQISRVVVPAARASRVRGAGPKYRKLLRTIEVPTDQQSYGEFCDWGYWSGSEWKGHKNLPPGYWVYIVPNWYIFGEAAGEPERPVVVEPAPPGKRSWGPEQATGPPDTQGSGDLQTAWASRTADGQDEWLRLRYAEAVVPSAVHIYETWNPGALCRITARKADGREVELWSGKDPVQPSGDRGVATIGVNVDFATDCITIHLKSAEVSGWNEIDAVGLLDAREKVHWAVSAEASSSWPDR